MDIPSNRCNLAQDSPVAHRPLGVCRPRLDSIFQNLKFKFEDLKILDKNQKKKCHGQNLARTC